MHTKALYYINKLKLTEHPEGGYYNEIYRSAGMFHTSGLSSQYKGNRNYSTTIYFLLEGKLFSSFHKLESDETWHHLDGSSVKIYILDHSGKLFEIILGKNLESGEIPFYAISGGNWFAAELSDKNSFALLTCNVSPGFEFEDFTLAKRNDLINLFPQHKEIIIKLTKA